MGARPASMTAPVTYNDDPGLTITRVEVLPLQEGDRVIIHVDGAAGMSSGGAAKAGQDVLAALKLTDLPFEVPVIVVAPGIRVEVARPS
jgi:hypothetical protein